MGSPQKFSSFKNLVWTIESLLGSKSDLTVTWAQSVKLIIEDLSSNASCSSTPSTPSLDSLEKSIEGELILLRSAYAFANLNRRLALHKLLDLKGNIRVFCRVRPIFPSDKKSKAAKIITELPDEVQISAFGKAKRYKFDKVFQPSSLQDDVFSEVEPIIRSAIDGNNVCIFAYGQTGTGKTFSMEGNRECPGIAPRALQQLFYDASLDRNAIYTFKLSILEVYKGGLQDLLVHRKDQQRLSIQMATTGSVEIENLTEITITSAAQATNLYRKGMRARSTSWTTANEFSSRSHCLVRININCEYKYGKKSINSKLWMIDLGGSERFFKTQAQGQTLEEGKAINVSLSALGDVLSALQRKQAHIPYRNSKLTQILRDCLGRHSKTLMLVHISSKEEDLGETICSLGFASRARGIYLGSASHHHFRDERMAMMGEVLKNMKAYEIECKKLSDDIQAMETKSLKPTTVSKDESSVQIITFSDSSTKKGSSAAAAALVIPRFMTPTMSSKSKKRSSDNQNTVNFVSMVLKTKEQESIENDDESGKTIRQVKRSLNFRVSTDSPNDNVHNQKNYKEISERCAWEECRLKDTSRKVRRRMWTLECSSKITTKRVVKR